MDGLAQGVVTYLKISIGEIFNMSDAVITLLQLFFKKFTRDGVTQYSSENVPLLVQ